MHVAVLLSLGLNGPPLLPRRGVITTGAALLAARPELGRAAQSNDDLPEFWKGRLSGAPPPKPGVFLRDAPPVVVLPGFGNDRIDYIAPNGCPPEVGLVATMERRGCRGVTVVPIARSQWLNVAKGLQDPAFLAGEGAPEGAAYAWYIESAKQTVESVALAGQRAVLVGHSAGGWLARALCAVAGDAWAKEHVRGIVTLGAPHASPPPGVADQTRGTIANINKRAPGAWLTSEGIFYVTVGSKKVVGSKQGDASAAKAFTSYNLVLGEGEGVAGDGFVPFECAMLNGATQVILDCFHSGGSADPWPKDDWYGSGECNSVSTGAPVKRQP